MKYDVLIEAKALQAKLQRISGDAKRRVEAVVAKHTEDLRAEVDKMVSRPVQRTKGRVVRSRPGQPPRRDSGKLESGVHKKLAGLKGYVTVDAKDEKGNRYPFMLEAGTRTMAKRPFIKKAQRKIKRAFVRDLVDVAKSL